MPWLIAAFLVVAWFLPIDSITPRGFSAFDLKLDRVILVAMALLWVPAAIIGSLGAPRLRGLGGIGLALAAFALLALAGVVFNAETLVQSRSWDLAEKKLFLLGSYVTFFLIVASTLRPREIEAFATLFMWLAFGAALLVIYDRFAGVNEFFELARRLFPASAFDIRPIDTSGFDRHPVTGPTRHGLAIAAMLAMALPFAMVRAIQDRSSRRWVYGAVVLVLLLAVWATNRKTGVYASAVALGTLCLLRPREMFLRVFPAAVLVLGVVALVKPNAVAFQIDRLSPGAVTQGLSSQARVSDYPAIVPDVHAHLLLGRGWGTYTFRILDNNWLALLIETGFLGVAAFASLLASVWAGAWSVMRRWGLDRAGPAIAGAAATSGFAMSMGLFDALAFAQVPYFFLFCAALVAASVRAALRPGLAPIDPPPRPSPAAAAAPA